MRKRTGTIIAKPSGFYARVWVKLPDGSEERRWTNLGTKDRTTAKRKLARMLAQIEAGDLVAEAEAKTQAPETYRSFTTDRHERRKAAGVVMARDEQNNRERYIYRVLGDLDMRRITDDHGRQVLEQARDDGLARETVHKIRAVMRRDFKRARIEKLIDSRPMEDLELPEGLKKDKRPFVSPTDAEIAKYLSAEKLDLELKLLALVARTEGGTRTAELIRWDWTMVDREAFAVCTIARAKTQEVQTLEIPTVLRPFLTAWWNRAGRPLAGPVFPVRRGPRAGKDKKARGTSFAGRLRRDFFRAGVVRLPPVVKDGKPVPNPADPLYFDTPVSRRMNFHSMRRAYARALAKADVNVQTAMTLASHADAKVHMGYVRELDAAKPVPLAALPVIDPGLAARLLSPAVTFSPGNDVSDAAQVIDFPIERDTGLEPATFGLGKPQACSQDGAAQGEAPIMVTQAEEGASSGFVACTAVSRGQLSPAGDSSWRVFGGVLFEPVEGAPDAVAARAEAVRAALEIFFT